MDIRSATAELQLGASLPQIASAYREELLRDFGFRPDEIRPETFREESMAFMRKLARHLGDRHAGETRIGHALREWVQQFLPTEEETALTFFPLELGRREVGHALLESLPSHPSECEPTVEEAPLAHLTAYAALFPDQDLFVATPRAGRPARTRLWRLDDGGLHLVGCD